MVEHFFDVERVRGSSPLPPTILFLLPQKVVSSAGLTDAMRHNQINDLPIINHRARR